MLDDMDWCRAPQKRYAHMSPEVATAQFRVEGSP